MYGRKFNEQEEEMFFAETYTLTYFYKRLRGRTKNAEWTFRKIHKCNRAVANNKIKKDNHDNDNEDCIICNNTTRDWAPNDRGGVLAPHFLQIMPLSAHHLLPW